MSSASMEAAAVQTLPPSAPTHSTTLRKPKNTYFQLRIKTLEGKEIDLDTITAKQHLDAAFTRYLGVLGSSISVDIFEVKDNEMIIRVPRETGNAVHEALSSWVGAGGIKYVILGKSDWLITLGMGAGLDLF